MRYHDSSPSPVQRAEATPSPNVTPTSFCRLTGRGGIVEADIAANVTGDDLDLFTIPAGFRPARLTVGGVDILRDPSQQVPVRVWIDGRVQLLRPHSGWFSSSLIWQRDI